MNQDQTLPIWNNLPAALQIRSHQGSVPFSRDILFRSILPSGIDYIQAAKIVMHVENRLQEEKRKFISSDTIAQLVKSNLSVIAGTEAVERLILWKKFIKSQTPFVIIVNGLPGLGMEDIVHSTAFRFGIQAVISPGALKKIDARGTRDKTLQVDIVNTLRKECKKKSSGNLSDEKIKQIFRDSTKNIQGLLNETIFNTARNKGHALLYGTFFTPHCIDLANIKNEIVYICVTAVVLNESGFYKRLKPLSTDKKTDTPVEALWDLQKHIVTESAHYGIPVVKLTHFDSAVSKIMQLAVQEIEKQISKERLFEDALENLRILLEEVHAPLKH